MRFQDRFEIPTAIRARDNVMAMTGTETSSGLPVTVHLLLERQSAETAELLQDIAGLSAERRRHILDEGDFEGIPYVITYPLPANITLRAWVSTPEQQRPSGEVLRPAGYKTPQPGEFTRLFQARSFEPLLQTSAPSATSDAPVNPSPEPAKKPGEFTALLNSFSTPKQTFNAPAIPPPSPPLIEKPPAAASEPGEFTRMMRSPLAPEGDAADAKPAMKPPPEDFTRLVQRDVGLANSGAPTLAPSRQAAQAPSEFTRMLRKDEPQSDDLFSSPAPVVSPVSSDGFATGAFSGHTTPAAPAPATGPSDFTRIITSPGASAPHNPPAPSSAAPQPQTIGSRRRTSYTPLIIALAVIVVIALLLIAVFVVQR